MKSANYSKWASFFTALGFDLTTRRIIISRHVVFDETYFPFSADPSSALPSSLDFLLSGHAVPVPRTATAVPSAVAPSLVDVEQPRPGAHLEKLPEDPAVLQVGPVVGLVPAAAPAGPPPAPAATSPLRVYTRRRAPRAPAAPAPAAPPAPVPAAACPAAAPPVAALHRRLLRRLLLAGL